MRHQQYREGLLERLRTWRVANVDGTITQAKNDLRSQLSEEDIDLLFDNWINANFDRIEVRSINEHSHTAVVRPLRKPGQRDATEEAAHRQRRDLIANQIATGLKSNLFEEFSARIWATILPNGVAMSDATGTDMKHAGGWYAELAKRLKPSEKVSTRFTTRDLFTLSQRDKFAVDAA